MASSYKDLIFTPKPESNWCLVTDRHAILNEPVEFRLHNGDTHLGYCMEMQPIGGGYGNHAFGVRKVYVAESDGNDEFFPPHHVVEWRMAKPFPKERFLGVCETSEEEHLGRLSSMFVSYLYLAIVVHQPVVSTGVFLTFHQTRHYSGVDGIEYWQTYIDVSKNGVTRTVTMHENDSEDYITFKQPRVDDQSFKYTQLAEAVAYITDPSRIQFLNKNNF